MEQEKKIKSTPDLEASEPTFLYLVSYNMLQERLISTGELDAGGSVLMVEHMEKTGKIEKTESYNVYRMGKPVTTQEEKWGNMR